MGYYVADKCPHCGVLLSGFRKGIWSKSLIGPGIMECWICHGFVRTGQSEWADKTKSEKQLFFLQAAWFLICNLLLIGVALPFSLVGIAALLNLIQSDQAIILAIVFLALPGGIFAIYWSIKQAKQEIQDSLKRKTKTPSSEDGLKN